MFMHIRCVEFGFEGFKRNRSYLIILIIMIIIIFIKQRQ